MLDKIRQEVEAELHAFFSASVITRAKSGADGAVASAEHNAFVARVLGIFKRAEDAVVSTAEDAVAAIRHVVSRGYSHEAAVDIVEEHGAAKILASKAADEGATGELFPQGANPAPQSHELPSANDLDAVAKEAEVAQATTQSAEPGAVTDAAEGAPVAAPAEAASAPAEHAASEAAQTAVEPPAQPAA